MKSGVHTGENSPNPRASDFVAMPGTITIKGIMSELRIGDNLPVDLLSFRASECLISTGPPESEDVCVLDAGHTGNHLAAGADMVVRAVWS